MVTRRVIATIASAALVTAGLTVITAPIASAEGVQGRWTGTVTMTSVASFDYRIGYRGSSTTRSQATSQHELSWILRFDDVQGTSDLAMSYGPSTLTNYAWSGSATSTSSDCGYSASGSLSLTNATGYHFDGMTESGGPAPSVVDAPPATLSLSRPGGDCTSGVVFGFSGPNAGTLGDDQWWDGFLLNPEAPEPSQYPRFSMCWHPEVITPAPAGADQSDGTRRVAGTSSGGCNGTKVEWFGDSDVSHVMDVDVTYTYDLTFTPVGSECNDGADNDGDGLVDQGSDPGCTGGADATELGDAECDNGVDDDGDGLADFRVTGGDPSCTSPLGLESSGCDDPLAGEPTADDLDGDRLPSIYESTILFTDPEMSDSDCDSYGDALEVASGSNPLGSQQTPANLPHGVIPGALAAKGQVGITCGRTKFRWVSVALDPLGVPHGARGCILLLSNRAANVVIDFALEHKKATVTSTLIRFFGDHLGEVHGEQSNDWQAEYQLDRRLSRLKREAKKMLFQAYNLAKFNNVFVIGKAAGLAGVGFGALFGMNQLRNNNACIQVRVGAGSGGTPQLSWSLVYSKEQLTREGVEDNLHRASVYKKKDGFLTDQAVKRITNLSCSYGKVRAAGSASEVFDAARSFAF